MLNLKELSDICLDDLTTSCSNQANENELRARKNVYSDLTTCAYYSFYTFVAQTTTMTRLKQQQSIVYYMR